ncbi:hypothetical protein C2M08_26020 [Klebsiella pneumoniae]|nr:hypothetical protein C2M08_26020 [Klebsiella pneumoniae]
MPAPNPPPSCGAWASPVLPGRGDGAVADQPRDPHRQPRQAERRRQPGTRPEQRSGRLRYGCATGYLSGLSVRQVPENREKFAKAWGVESLPAHTGYRISELPHRAAHGEVRAAYIMGEDPLQTDAELSAVRKAFDDLELVIVQDIFMTKTASAADVILPSTSWGEHEGVYTAADRGFQRFFKAWSRSGT